MRSGLVSIVLFFGLLLAGCAAQPPAPSETVQAPQETRTGSRVDPTNPDRSCKTDADCAVKDVGNCCGYYPACVNKDAPTDPAAVQAQCAKEGMASICGFPSVSGCRCVDNRCQDITGGLTQ